jgi:modulator of FtsH protease
MNNWSGSGPQFGVVGAGGRAEVGTVSLAEKVMGLTCLMIGLATAGVVVGGYQSAGGASVGGGWLFWILEIAAVIGTMLLADVPVLGFVLFCGVGFLTGLSIAPIIHAFVASGQGVIVFQALAATAAVSGALTLYARSTSRDFSGMGGYLFAVLIGLIVASVIGIFVHSTLLQIIISGVACVLFSLYLVYDVQRIATTQATKGNAIRLALSLYLDIFNLFLNLLYLLGVLEGERR